MTAAEPSERLRTMEAPWALLAAVGTLLAVVDMALAVVDMPHSVVVVGKLRSVVAVGTLLVVAAIASYRDCCMRKVVLDKPLICKKI